MKTRTAGSGTAWLSHEGGETMESMESKELEKIEVDGRGPWTKDGYTTSGRHNHVYFYRMETSNKEED